MAEVQGFQSSHQPSEYSPEGIGQATARGLSVQWTNSNQTNDGITLITYLSIARDRLQWMNEQFDDDELVGALSDLDDVIDRIHLFEDRRAEDNEDTEADDNDSESNDDSEDNE